METLLAYITTKDKEEARKIGRHLVEERLAACVNILEGMESLYHWEGKLQTSNECVLIAKTISANEAKVTHAVCSLHSYSVPCILYFKVHSGSPHFIRWVHDRSKGEN